MRINLDGFLCRKRYSFIHVCVSKTERVEGHHSTKGPRLLNILDKIFLITSLINVKSINIEQDLDDSYT